MCNAHVARFAALSLCAIAFVLQTYGAVPGDGLPGPLGEPWGATDGSRGGSQLPPIAPERQPMVDDGATWSVRPPRGAPAGASDDGGLAGTCANPQPGDIIEGEPLCANGSVDAFNGGCNSTPNVFDSIGLGQTVAGKYGTFLTTSGSNFRDTDWYHFTLSNRANITWSATGEATTRIFILQGTCPASSLGTAVAAACATASITVSLDAGTYNAFVATDAFSGVPCGSRYRATLKLNFLEEGEPDCATGYVDAFNGGCNSSPAVYDAIACGQIMHGKYGTFQNAMGANNRDTDWYRFTIASRQTITWSATGTATTRVFILNNACPTSSLGTAVAPAGTAATITLTLDPGTYSGFVGTDAFTGVPCGSTYVASLSCGYVCNLEGEPDCANGYVDAFNGGCNSTPNVFDSISCGQTICGEYGTFQSATGSNVRDTDWYTFVLGRRTTVTWSASGTATTRVFVMTGTCPASSLGTAAAAAGSAATVTLTLEPGVYRGFVGTDAFTGVPCGSTYTVSLNCVDVCRVEGEPDCANGYDDQFNAGCNTLPSGSPPTYLSISPCDTVCGEYGTFTTTTGSNFRDTDWYRFALADDATVTWSVTGTAATRAYILQGSCPAASLGTDSAPAGEAAVVTLSLAAGTYFAFAGTDVFTGVACGSTYTATLTSSLCAPFNPADINHDGDVNTDDLILLIGSWGSCPLPCPPRCLADIAPPGGNCIVNTDDLIVIITNWG